MEAKTKITVSATIDAPMDKVWEAFSQPEHVTKWCFASDDWHAPHATCDFREGGKASTRMEAKDGSFGFDFGWTYTKIDENEMIHYIMEDGRENVIDFEETDNGVKVTETFDAESQNPVEMQREGWQAILNNFKKYVEGN